MVTSPQLAQQADENPAVPTIVHVGHARSGMATRDRVCMRAE
jgi:hypothetical protein